MRDLTVDFPDDEEVYALGSSLLRQSGRFDEARRLSLIFELRRPDSALPRIDRLHALAREGNATALRQTTDEFLQCFGQDEKNLLAMGDVAATTGDAILARQVSSRLPAPGQAGQSATMLTLETLVTAKDYTAALTLADDLTAGTPNLGEPLLTLCHRLKAIAHYGRNDPAAGFLAYYRNLAGTRRPVESLLKISNLLMRQGQVNRPMISWSAPLQPIHRISRC